VRLLDLPIHVLQIFLSLYLTTSTLIQELFLVVMQDEINQIIRIMFSIRCEKPLSISRIYVSVVSVHMNHEQFNQENNK
jgi:hypothetical protein